MWTEGKPEREQKHLEHEHKTEDVHTRTSASEDVHTSTLAREDTRTTRTKGADARSTEHLTAAREAE